MTTTTTTSNQPAFNRILDNLSRRQLEFDFDFGGYNNFYTPERNIGQGAFGIVCEASDSQNNDKVAIKKIGHASATPTLARRTLREIRCLRYIEHDNIVLLKDIFRTKGSLGINVFLVMDLMEGSLHHVIHGSIEPLDWELISYFLFQLLKGLRFLHAAGISHRDLKPSNLLVNSDCHLRIADFGMAKLSLSEYYDDADEYCFYMTQHVATLPYRAPELLFVCQEHSVAVDMWAVGCILGEMILRREIFPGKSVSNQIKVLITRLGSPSLNVVSDIKCERTKRLIESFGDVEPWNWSDIITMGDRYNEYALDLIQNLLNYDQDERFNVFQAIEHEFLSEFNKNMEAEPTCPFKTKMDMAAVESLTHQELLEAILNDIKSADGMDDDRKENDNLSDVCSNSSEDGHLKTNNILVTNSNDLYDGSPSGSSEVDESSTTRTSLGSSSVMHSPSSSISASSSCHKCLNKTSVRKSKLLIKKTMVDEDDSLYNDEEEVTAL
uniref:Mitogen-activated protein kinase 7 (inferred by orthology to a human protein) n=1 Tax=Strongyloides venezuelensis TaxID=75913 RepID=A0A0K0FJH6_STRVS